MEIISGKYICSICNKKYSSYKSLWNHNKKFHTKIVSNVIEKNMTNVIPVNENVLPSIKIKKYLCVKCNREFNSRQRKWSHEKICKIQLQADIKTNELEELKGLKNSILEFLKNNAKIHPKTLQKINKQLINNNTNNTNNINNGTVNNGPVINNTFVRFGNEQLSQLLNDIEMNKIIKHQCKCIEESIKKVHFNDDLPEYKNIFITNMRDSIAYIFDGSNFIPTTKDVVLNELFNNHLDNIQSYLEEAEIPENKYIKISKFLEKLNDEEKAFIDESANKKRYTNYKSYKLNELKLIVYCLSKPKLLKALKNIELKEKIIEEQLS
jgi:DNA-directed RNA polymerase subunit RPC12/RpoP